MVKYLFYNARARWEEGLSDRRSCLMILLAEAKLSNRVAIIPKFSLGAKHNNGKKRESYIVDEYCIVDKIGVEYLYLTDFTEIRESIDEEDVLNITEDTFDYNSQIPLVVRNLKDDNFWNLHKLQDVIQLAKLYQGNGAKFIIPLAEPTNRIKEIGDIVLDKLKRPIVGLHLRRTDRLNKPLAKSMNENIIKGKIEDFTFNSVYYCSNDPSYRLNGDAYFTFDNFEILRDITEDNFLLFCVEMYIVDNCDISIRTFKDSSPFFYGNSADEKNYAICDYGMHMSFSQSKKIPNKFVRCFYDNSKTNEFSTFFDKKVDKKTYLKSLVLRFFASVKYRIKSKLFKPK